MKKLSITILIMLLCLVGCKNNNNSIESATEEAKTMSYTEMRATENVIDDKYRTYYEVFVYSFYDSDNDGIGDIKGLISKLDYIENLGCNGIWLMPIMPSTTYHKYDITDYYSVDAQYGSLDDFNQLIEECHKRDINVIIDMVFNHTSAKHDWFVKASQYLTTLKSGEEIDLSKCPYANYYNFAKTSEAPASYHKLSGTDYSYECVFWDQMPDLNLDSKAVRDEIEKITKYWLDLGVDGFRLDAAKEYYSGNNDKNIEALTWYTDYVSSIDKEAYLVAEVWDSYDVICKYYESGIDSIFDYTFGNNNGVIVKTVNNMGNGKAGNRLAQNLEIIQSEFKIDAPFLSNHDTGRIAGFVSYDEDKIKLAGAINLLMNGSAFLYYGEEIGMTGAGEDVNKRAPMYWCDNEEKNQENNEDEINVLKQGITAPPPGMGEVEHRFGSYISQKDNQYSIYNYYRQLIHIRNKYPEIARGTVEVMFEITDGDICAIKKEYNKNTIYVIYNISNEEKAINLMKDGYRIAESLMTGKEEAGIKGDTLNLPAYGIVVLTA